MDKLVIADVGHGNSTLIFTDQGAIIIDAACGSTVKDILNSYREDSIRTLVASHADSDHIAGITTLLLDDDIKVDKIFLNPDGLKATKAYQSFRRAVKVARMTANVEVFIGVDSHQSEIPTVGGCSFEVLSPNPDMLMTGVGSNDLQGRRMTANSMSIVVKILHEENPVALVAGDVDEVAFENMLEEGMDVCAPILVFPHHGGRLGGNTESFSRALCEEVVPSYVFFSNGRDRFDNPREEVVQGVKAGCGAYIACTQLSKRCCTEIPDNKVQKSGTVPSKGDVKGHACAGTTSITLDEGELCFGGVLERHQTFVSQFPNRLCQR